MVEKIEIELSDSSSLPNNLIYLSLIHLRDDSKVSAVDKQMTFACLYGTYSYNDISGYQLFLTCHKLKSIDGHYVIAGIEGHRGPRLCESDIFKNIPFEVIGIVHYEHKIPFRIYEHVRQTAEKIAERIAKDHGYSPEIKEEFHWSEQLRLASTERARKLEAILQPSS